ncbi:MAG: FHA domain-containing protein [Myxococcales bacterium]|nr:FHA domain-containing protein [Myxococcales bacterium]MCB9567557.1 FHA domain-containing protein [Myxococcales bacterium]MCB9700569.1 FHA domain-containing protein [Myxococcales bacterium]
MATLASSADVFALPTRALIGRSRDCDLVLPARDVSSRHATLEWNGADWQLRDLGSRNGTWLEGQRLVGDARPVVCAGARLRFGHDSEWVLEDASPPELMARSLTDGAWRLAQGGYLALPSADAPERCVYRDRQGRWVVSGDEGDAQAIDDRELLVMADASAWRVHLPGADASTWQEDPAGRSLARLRLQLAYSRDEEYVEAVALCGDERLDLKARAHHYTLLILARRRLADRAAGVAEAEEGWIRQDELGDMLRMSDNHLYITIHRARAQLGELGVADAAGLVERRPGTRQLRLGVADLELIMLNPR